MTPYVKPLILSGLLIVWGGFSSGAWGQNADDALASMPKKTKNDRATKKGAVKEEKVVPHYRADSWQNKTVAIVMVLNRIDSNKQQLSIPVGSTQNFETLKIGIKGCVVRPVGISADAAAFLSIEDEHITGKVFNAWVFSQEPSLSVYENPVYNVQLVGCKGQDTGPAPETVSEQAEPASKENKKTEQVPPSRAASSTGQPAAAEQEPTVENPVPGSP